MDHNNLFLKETDVHPSAESQALAVDKDDVTGASHGLAQFSSAPERLPCSETHSLVLLECCSLERSGFAFTVENTGARN